MSSLPPASSRIPSRLPEASSSASSSFSHVQPRASSSSSRASSSKQTQDMRAPSSQVDDWNQLLSYSCARCLTKWQDFHSSEKKQLKIKESLSSEMAIVILRKFSREMLAFLQAGEPVILITGHSGTAG